MVSSIFRLDIVCRNDVFARTLTLLGSDYDCCRRRQIVSSTDGRVA